ncbi:MAG: hypothetical protein J5818_02395, partial [Eggerthellaceae bacterium]|nr:hypothetical protein [Eggerthellaceae bacterium]
EMPFEVMRAGITVEPLSEAAYTGKPIELAPVVKRSGSSDELVEGRDYLLEVFDQAGTPVDLNAVTNIGDYRVVVSGIGNYAGTWEGTLRISGTTFKVDPIASVRYNGKVQVPDLVVRPIARTDSSSDLVAGVAVGLNAPTSESAAKLRAGASSGGRLVEDVDYTVRYGRVDADAGTIEWGLDSSDLVDVASYRIEVTGIGDHEGTLNVAYDITPAQLAIAGDIAPLTFNAQPQEVSVDVEGVLEDERVALTPEVDYELAYTYQDMSIDADQIIHAGSYEVLVTGKGNYAGSVNSRVFSIEQATLSIDEIPSAVYDTSVLVPEIVVRAGDVVLSQDYYKVEYRIVKDSDSYEVDRSRLAIPGNYLVRVIPTEGVSGDFANAGSVVEAQYHIDPAPLTVQASDLTYTGSGQTPVLSVKSGERVLAASEYRVAFYSSSGQYAGLGSVIAAGDYIARVTPVTSGCYEVDEATGAVSAGFAVKKASVSLDSIEDLTYTGKALSPKIVVRSGSRVLGEREYTVQYLNASGGRVNASQLVDAGRYTVRVALADAANYEEQSLTAQFTIVKPAGGDDSGGNGEGGGGSSSGSSGGSGSTSSGGSAGGSGSTSTGGSSSGGGGSGWAYQSTGTDGTPVGTERLGGMLISTPVTDSEFDDEDFTGLLLGKYDPGDGSSSVSGLSGSQGGAGGTAGEGGANSANGNAAVGDDFDGSVTDDLASQDQGELVEAVQDALASSSQSGLLPLLLLLLIALPSSYYYLFKRRKRDENELKRMVESMT